MRLPPSVLARAQSWRTTFRATTANRLALFCDDRHQFTAVLFAAWAERKQVVLPGDLLPATLSALSAHVDAWVGDFPGETLQPGAPLDAPWAEPDREAEGLVVFTSGSTGTPTAITKRLRQLFDEVTTLEATFGPRLTGETSLISTVSHQHIYGLLFSVLWPIATGRTLTPHRLEYPEQLEQALSAGPCALISSPAHLKRLPEGRRWNTQLRAIFSSGGPLPAEGAERARAVLGFQPIEIFGSSETGGVAWREGTTSPWRRMAGIELRQSPTGTLDVRSPHLATSGWFSTADRVELTGDTFTLRGRADRIAKIEEKRVSLELIERSACATGLVKDARVVVLDGARVTLGLVAVPTTPLDRKQLVEQLKHALEGSVERVALPRRYRFVDALPHNAQGKVTESTLVSLFANEALPFVPSGVEGLQVDESRSSAVELAPGPSAVEVPLDSARGERGLGIQPAVKWTERTPTHAALELTISPDLLVLEGHFPGTPVVPGVAQLDWAITWGREAFPTTGNLTRLEVLKFQALMMPGHAVKLALDWNAEKSTLTFKFTSDKSVYSSGRVVLSR